MSKTKQNQAGERTRRISDYRQYTNQLGIAMQKMRANIVPDLSMCVIAEAVDELIQVAAAVTESCITYDGLQVPPTLSSIETLSAAVLLDRAIATGRSHEPRS